MHALGNLALGVALFFYLYPWMPDLPKVRAAILRLRRGPIGPIYALFFVLMPRFLRLLLAAFAVWNFLALALIAVVHRGELEWTGLTGEFQYGLIAAGCVAMAVVTLFKTLAHFDVTYKIWPAVRRASQGLALGAPPLVMGFALLALNPPLAQRVAPALFHGPLIAMWGLSLLVAGAMIFRWLRPVAQTAATGITGEP